MESERFDGAVEEKQKEEDDKGKGKAKKIMVKPIEEKPLLRGILKVSEGKLVWSGKWAMSASKFKEGEKSKFKYVYTETGEEINDDKIEPKDGIYRGYFVVKDATAESGMRKIEEKKVKLRFFKHEGAMHKVKGTGTNKFGEFVLEGKYDPASHKMALEKEYLAQEQEEEEEDAEFIADDDDDDDDVVEDGDDIDKDEELATLNEEANMSVEELRKRYYGGGGGGDDDAGNGSSSSSSKRPKVDE
uniref:Uncharacterized protein n=1 Tax=Aplanochytrium stocchinoi TaxID=215587 RepID=A0A7S3LK04_9STRA|mmetsp:Transcript_15432/g.18263  ORF Transcript_15432/g.18263 Transcript_15432/m.18263 type:complete len:245 (-) Transcript_15432:971-1705(-)|eukprot:CAMPEP_0204832532 /NCGR_PEP_ID=MMETSP1346-20131115/14061_1 /ASSEMBLY_ACC=CAM_ASM_000771 /TAXON_ID=215587 /ORGANISM="Aplanochytrium stocchinoi, Strain GSBS06" /LENGTH=244 /DNA_ID=CAMNT_0051964407 /DNA_START=43 /DNA_END=777 /DNA_ORIENTATION=-